MIDFAELSNILEEIEQDKEDLHALDLTEEEIEGYIEMFKDNFFPATKIKERKKN